MPVTQLPFYRKPLIGILLIVFLTLFLWSDAVDNWACSNRVTVYLLFAVIPAIVNYIGWYRYVNERADKGNTQKTLWGVMVCLMLLGFISSYVYFQESCR